MITTYYGDALAAPQGVIVHGCNCQGVMGGGIARTVRERYPTAYKVYRDKYESEVEPGSQRFTGLKLGEITSVQVDVNKFIVNANTQDNHGTHRRQVDYEAVARCFEKVNFLAYELSKEAGFMLPIIFPQIGAGLGGGNWKIIEAIIDETLSPDFEKHLYIFQP